MSNQPTLWGFNENETGGQVRSTDPATSQRAAMNVRVGSYHAMIILMLADAYPKGMTARAVAEASGSSDVGSGSSDVGSGSSDVGSHSSDVQSHSSDARSTSSDVRSTSSDVRSTSSDVRSGSSERRLTPEKANTRLKELHDRGLVEFLRDPNTQAPLEAPTTPGNTGRVHVLSYYGHQVAVDLKLDRSIFEWKQ